MSRLRALGVDISFWQGKPDFEKMRKAHHDFLENIKEGRTESQIVPHALTLSILHTLDQCRYKAGIRYAGETEGETL